MGLITFAVFLIAVDLTLIGDDEYRFIFRIGERVAAHARRWIARVLAKALPHRLAANRNRAAAPK